MKENPDSPSSFRVVWSAKVRTILKRMSGQAAVSLRQRLAGVLRDLDARLAQDPLSVGEVYRTRKNIAEQLAVHEFLAIDFAVDQSRSLVLVRDCWALSGHGLE